MKVKFTSFAVLTILFFSANLFGQKPFYPKPNISNDTTFSRKIPTALLNKLNNYNSPNRNSYPSGVINYQAHMSMSHVLVPGKDKAPATSAVVNSVTTVNSNGSENNEGHFHLTRDINTCTPGSYPNSDNRYNFIPGYSMIDNIIYFGADDGIHGMELWRSDGTNAGTYIVKDINPGPSASGVTSIIVAKGKLYFSAYTDSDGWEPWVSDGTEAGTKEIIQIDYSIPHMYSEGFIQVNNKVFFTTNSDFGSDLFITDGTAAGTSLLYNFNLTDPYAGYITEPVAAHGLLFFSAWTPSNGRELWRSDGTPTGTFMVKDVGPDQSDYYSPLQLTEYDGKLYYSGDDGTGRKLWCSDGTAAGTLPAPNTGNVLTQNDYTAYTTNMPFAVMNHVLYFSGFTYADGSGLYKYDATSQAGVTLVKDLTSGPEVDFITAPELRAIDNTLYFKVVNSIGGYHDEIWTSKGKANNTQMIKVFDVGKATFNYFGVYDQLYFAVYDPVYGTEPWTTDGTTSGTSMLKDIFKGSQSSNPFFFTPYKGKVLFNAGDGKIGTELWVTNGTEEGTIPVKDINASSTNNSDAGLFIKGIGSLGDYAMFGAFEPEHGGELYRSDGTNSGTVLLNDIAAGDNWSYPNSFLNKNEVDYFIGDNLIGTTIYKSNGTKEGLQQIVYNIDRSVYYVEGFNVTDNGLPFFILVNRYTGAYELWRSDGTAAGTYSLSPNLFLNYGDYIVTVGNTAFFTADDGIHGPQVWKSDGTLAGTQMVKNINPSGFGSYPYSLFAFKNAVYFGAYDGSGYYYSLWKTDGTESGTIKLKDVTPAYWSYYGFYYNHYYSQYFCVSGNTLYFNAADYSANPYQGAELWKTNGTPQSTKLVKDINPFYDSYPSNLVDVNGTLFFMADDGTDGNELWSSNGTAKGTKLVQDITPGYGGSYLDNLVSAGGKLYFVKDDGWFSTLWSADCSGNANPVTDPGLKDLHNIQALTAAGNKLFFNAFTPKYGTELYAGEAGSDKPSFSSTTMIEKGIVTEPDISTFSARLYPNPSNGPAALQITGAVGETLVTITDMSGRIIWQNRVTGATVVNLPADKIAAGVYTVSVKSGQDNKTLKLVKL